MERTTATPTFVFWHRQLPPLDAEIVGEHTVEASSHRVHGTISRRDQLWDECYEALMRETERRLEQELARLGGRFAHVLHESIDGQRNDATNESWLHGRFTYLLLK